MGVTSRTEYKVVRMPRHGMSGDGDPDPKEFEVLLNKLVGEGWSPILLPLDMYQPAFIVSRSHKLNLDEQINEVMDRIADINIWAPEVWEHDQTIARVLDEVPEPARSRLIKAVLAVK